MIIVKLSGGMGNQLFQYIFGLKWAQYHGVNLKVDLSSFDIKAPGTDSRPFVLDLFQLELEQATPQDYKSIKIPLPNQSNIWNKIIKRISARYITQKGMLDLYQDKIIPDNSYLDGYWIGKYTVIEQWENLKPKLKIKANQLVDSEYVHQIQNSTSVCIHIRRGDYVTANKFLLPISYFEQGIIEMRRQRPESLHFFIFSDDILWCKTALSNFIKEQDVKITFADGNVPSGQHDINHFHLMTCCNHFIISNSTFSWWAAKLGSHPNKIVICPSQFEASNTQHPHLILDHWIPIAIN